MAHITFYTKFGCMTSAKQIELLRQSGHDVEVCDLLLHPWTADELVLYFGEKPVKAWFNPNSPRVKSGEIDPEAYDVEGALSLMITDHLLIRRPLMELNGIRLFGFDPATIHALVGLKTTVFGQNSITDYSSCSQQANTTSSRCP